MTVKTFDVSNIGVREANAIIREATATALEGIRIYWTHDVEANHERRRNVGEDNRVDHVFGIGTDLRDTWVASVRIYTPGTDERMDVCFPSNYKGWHQSDPYTHLRVMIHDRIVSQLRVRGIFST